MAHSGVWIDDSKLQDRAVRVLVSSSEPMLTGVRTNTVTLPQRHGAIPVTSMLEPKPFVLDCVFERMDYAAMKAKITEIKRLFIDGNGRPKTVKLRFEDEPDRYYNVRVSSGIDIERAAQLGRFSIGLTAYDPYALSVATSDEVLWGSEEVVFLSDYTMGHTAGGAETFTGAGTMDVVVTGDNVKPVIYVTGSGTNVTIGWGGKTLTLGAFTSASFIIDLERFTVVKDGVNAIGAIGGDWLTMELAQGTTTVSVGGTGLNAEVSFSYRDRWYG